MKKFYALAVVLLFVAGSASAQNFYWIGPANGNWGTAANWSNTSGGGPASVIPNDPAHNVIFDASATINLNTSVTLNSLSVTGTTTNVTITAVGGLGNGRSITVNSTNAGSPGLSIAAGCRLENTFEAQTEFAFIFPDNGKGSISGDWRFSGTVDDNGYAYFILPDGSGQTTALTVNNGGSITVGQNTITSSGGANGDNYLNFAAGSSLNLLSTVPYIPAGNYNTTSTINITGATESAVFEEGGEVGTINYNSPAQNAAVNLDIILLTIKGNLNVLNTNNNELVFFDQDQPALTTKQATIQGNLNIQGTSVFSVAHNFFSLETTNTLSVTGNVTANGTSFNIHTGPDISTRFTKLAVGGTLSHTAGTFGASSTVVNQTTDLYIIELNGVANQNVSSVTGTFDNAGNQVTLRMNNAAGATLLSSLHIGRIDFSSTNKGVLTTGSNTLFIDNNTPNSGSTLVVNSPSQTGYVNGTVRRRSQSTEPFVIPTGGAAGYRPTTLIPNSNTLTVFEATHFNTAYSDLSVVSPLEGVTPDYYWIVNRISGTADAAVQFSIPGTVTNSQSNYALVVAKYNGADWVNEKGTTGLSVVPGTATSGTLRSQVQTSFSPFTIGFGLASALPTHLVSFTGRKSLKETIELKWKITDNSTPESFEVTRSSDGINFVKIGSVAGSEYVRSYDFVDGSILSGNNYYRLRMLDRDGAVTFSTIVVVSNGAKGVYLHSVTPSVVQGRTKLNIQSSENTSMQLVVTDINGRIVHKQSISVSNGTQDVWLDAARFSSGVFQVTGFVKGVKTATLRFIKL